jgi:hypothetical protein
MAFTFEPVSIEDVKTKLSKRTRTSKWRENLEAFMAAELPAAKIDTDDGDMKPGSVASGLNNAIKTAKDTGSPYPVQVKQTTSVDGTKSVYLIRTDLVDMSSNNEAEAEAEPVEA